MKFAEDQNDALYKITGYDDQGIFINGRLFQSAVILSPMDIVENWEPQSYSQFDASHLSALYNLKPEVIILGTGKKQAFPSREVLQTLTKTALLRIVHIYFHYEHFSALPDQHH